MGGNRTEALTMAFPQQNEIEVLSEKCPRLELLEASMLKVPTLGQVSWALAEGSWEGNFTNITE